MIVQQSRARTFEPHGVERHGSLHESSCSQTSCFTSRSLDRPSEFASRQTGSVCSAGARFGLSLAENCRLHEVNLRARIRPDKESSKNSPIAHRILMNVHVTTTRYPRRHSTHNDICRVRRFHPWTKRTSLKRTLSTSENEHEISMEAHLLRRNDNVHGSRDGIRLEFGKETKNSEEVI